MANTSILEQPTPAPVATSSCFLTCPFRGLLTTCGLHPHNPAYHQYHHRAVNPGACVPSLVTDTKFIAVMPKDPKLSSGCWLAVCNSNDNALRTTTGDWKVKDGVGELAALIDSPCLVPSHLQDSSKPSASSLPRDMILPSGMCMVHICTSRRTLITHKIKINLLKNLENKMEEDSKK